jgi:hypothetical protein
MHDLLTSTNVQAEYQHTNKEISKVIVEAVCLDMRKVKKANLTPEVPDRTFRMALGKFEEVWDIQGETCSTATRSPMALG